MEADVLSKVEDREEWIFWCPGCECAHFVNASWTRSGTDEAPTIRPSILVRGHVGGKGGTPTRCHIYVTNGQIRFLSDCTHKLAGQTVPMTPIDDI